MIKPQTDRRLVALFLSLASLCIAAVYFYANPAHAAGLAFSLEINKFTVAQTAIELKTASGKRHAHYDCEVDEGEVGILYIGESDVSSTNYGKHRVAAGEWGGPHGSEYVIASGAESVIVRCRFVVSN